MRAVVRKNIITVGNDGTKSMSFSNAGFDITGTETLVSVKAEKR